MVDDLVSNEYWTNDFFYYYYWSNSYDPIPKKHLYNILPLTLQITNNISMLPFRIKLSNFIQVKKFSNFQCNQFTGSLSLAGKWSLTWSNNEKRVYTPTSCRQVWKHECCQAFVEKRGSSWCPRKGKNQRNKNKIKILI